MKPRYNHKCFSHSHEQFVTQFLSFDVFFDGDWWAVWGSGSGTETFSFIGSTRRVATTMIGIRELPDGPAFIEWFTAFHNLQS